MMRVTTSAWSATGNEADLQAVVAEDVGEARGEITAWKP